jgi:hypothetical protein
MPLGRFSLGPDRLGGQAVLFFFWLRRFERPDARQRDRRGLSVAPVQAPGFESGQLGLRSGVCFAHVVPAYTSAAFRLVDKSHIKFSFEADQK